MNYLLARFTYINSFNFYDYLYMVNSTPPFIEREVKLRWQDYTAFPSSMLIEPALKIKMPDSKASSFPTMPYLKIRIMFYL